jgi:formyltetrahydrofolate hydrolase
VRRQAGHVLAVEQDLSAARLDIAGDDVEKGRLARAVRADQAGDRPALDFQRRVFDGMNAAELLVSR